MIMGTEETQLHSNYFDICDTTSSYDFLSYMCSDL